jgi:hypothetical protein
MPDKIRIRQISKTEPGSEKQNDGAGGSIAFREMTNSQILMTKEWRNPNCPMRTAALGACVVGTLFGHYGLAIRHYPFMLQ